MVLDWFYIRRNYLAMGFGVQLRKATGKAVHNFIIFSVNRQRFYFFQIVRQRSYRYCVKRHWQHNHCDFARSRLVTYIHMDLHNGRRCVLRDWSVNHCRLCSSTGREIGLASTAKRGEDFVGNQYRRRCNGCRVQHPGRFECLQRGMPSMFLPQLCTVSIG